MKNIILIAFLFFIYSCGYTSVYKNSNNQDYKMEITEISGDRELNSLIENQINLYSNKNSSNIFNLIIKTKFEKLVLSKEKTGSVTNYELTANSEFVISIGEKSKTVTFTETINIDKKTDTFEQDLYEKNIKRNFASSIREKLISEITTLK